MNRKKRNIFFLILAILIILMLFFLFYFTRPSVLYIESEVLSSFDIDKPKPLTLNYRVKYINEAEALGDNVDLIILDPFANFDTNNDIKSYRWGNISSGGSNFILDEEKLWSYALSNINGTIAILYPDNLQLATTLLDEYPEVKAISYNGRISNANAKEIVEKLQNIANVLLLDPESSKFILQEDSKVFYVDFRDKVAFSDRKNVKAICPDWDSAIQKALQSEGDDISFDFTLS